MTFHQLKAEGFENVYHEDGDDIIFNKEKKAVVIEMSQCASHRHGFCQMCWTRVKKVVEFADKLMEQKAD